MNVIITFGTFDVFHIGHLRILQRARQLGERLIVGISSDAVKNQNERMDIVAGLKCVDSVFLEESLEKKADYIRQYSADTLVMGDDWAGRFDSLSYLCEVVYFPRTPSISTTSIIEVVKKY